MNDLIRDPLNKTIDDYLRLRQESFTMVPYLWIRYQKYIEGFSYKWNEAKFFYSCKVNIDLEDGYKEILGLSLKITS